MSVVSEYSEIDEYLQDLYSNTYFYEETALDIWNNCVVLSVLSVLPTLLKLILCNFVFGCLLISGKFSTSILHVISGFSGLYLVTTLESSHGGLIFLICWTIAFLLLQIRRCLQKYTNNSNLIKIVSVALLIYCEYHLINPQLWLQIRGIIMILVMKLISLSDDTEKLQSVPSLVEYFGYTLCGANILFGPWISFSDYLNLFKKPVKKNILIWICAIIKTVASSLFFLTLSNCWSGYFINEDSNRWLIAYKEAFAFRTSHYFISFLAEAGMVAAGFSNQNKRGVQHSYGYVITEPLEIEFPSSLSVVVKKWNQPMHEFLKKYVFQSWLNYGKFAAILATFVISSLLHGLELKVSMVLINIGVFSYLQVAPRNRIAEVFDCCVRIRPCKDCKHKYKRNSIVVKILLLMYSLGTVFHLAYLGVLMDPSTDTVGVYKKWQNLYFISHILMFFNVMVIS